MLDANLTVLVAEDDLDVCRLWKVYLGNRAKVYEAHDGATALDSIRQHRPDVVFLDIGLPGKLDGLAVLREMRRDPQLKKTQVVIVSGRNPRSLDEQDVLQADAYITKPFNRQDLQDWYQSYKTGWRRWLSW